MNLSSSCLIIKVWIIMIKNSQMACLQSLSVIWYHSLNWSFICFVLLTVSHTMFGIRLTNHLLLWRTLFSCTVHWFVDSHDTWKLLLGKSGVIGIIFTSVGWKKLKNLMVCFGDLADSLSIVMKLASSWFEWSNSLFSIHSISTIFYHLCANSSSCVWRGSMWEQNFIYLQKCSFIVNEQIKKISSIFTSKLINFNSSFSQLS